jgi:hypothetical protein
MMVSSPTAMIGQIQSCRFRKTPVRETVRPTLEVAHVMCGDGRRFPLADRRNKVEKFIAVLEKHRRATRHT